MSKKCPSCGGSGLIARPVSTLADNDHVKRYLGGMPGKGQELCFKCGGSGVVPGDPDYSHVQETKPAAVEGLFDSALRSTPYYAEVRGPRHMIRVSKDGIEIDGEMVKT